mgnify:CR=1 FL=1
MFAIWWLIDEVRISVEKVWYCTSTFVKLVGGRIIEVEGQSGIFVRWKSELRKKDSRSSHLLHRLPHSVYQ